MKPAAMSITRPGRCLSVLSVEPYGMKLKLQSFEIGFSLLSVLSVEPYGMKLKTILLRDAPLYQLSVLSVEPYGMKLSPRSKANANASTFSALGRAVWDETSRALNA